MKIGKNVLLTGAGFAKCFGGFLGENMQQRLFNLACQRKIEPLKFHLLRGVNYERAYDLVMDDGQQEQAVKTAVRRALMDLYGELDHALTRQGVRRGFALRNFLEYFQANDDEKGFVFTLNQDLLLERWWSGTPCFSMPGVLNKSGKKVSLTSSTMFNNSTFTRSDDKMLFFLPDAQAAEKIDPMEESTPLTYVKLHGSMNFVSGVHGKEVMVVGTQKSSQIAQEPLLKKYEELFKSVLMSGGVRLLIIGYGFNDQNINRLLFEALEKAGLRIFIMDPTQDVAKFRMTWLSRFALPMGDRMAPLSADYPNAERLVEQMDGYFKYHLLDDVYPDQNDNNHPPFREIASRYFMLNVEP